MLAADAVRELLRFEPGKPALLAEAGAVEPGHAGPFKLYQKDRDGVILHDVLFAPFFTGAAGTGQIWHWDHYVAANNLWFQFGRFAEAIKGIDPVAEEFRTVALRPARLRVYALRGKHTFLAWCRDSENTWQSELAEGKAPAVVKDASFELPELGRDMNKAEVRFYDPWTDRWSKGKVKDGRLNLPEFKRSIVVRVGY